MYGNDLSSRSRTLRRPVALDEVLLEVERLDLGPGDDHLEVGDSRDHPADPRPGVAALLEVAAHARPERLRLADIEDLPVRVAEQVDARLCRQRLQLGLEGRGHSIQCSLVPRAEMGSSGCRTFCTIALPACSLSGNEERKVDVGVWEYFIRDPDPATATQKMQELTDAGFRAAITNSFWEPGRREPSAQELAELTNAARAAQAANVRPMLIVQSPGSGTTPNTAELRAEFAAYAASIARRRPPSATSSSATSRTSTASGCLSSGRTARTWRHATTSRSSPRPTTR